MSKKYGTKGGDEGARTPDLDSAIVALSQLSYIPLPDTIIAYCRHLVKRFDPTFSESGNYSTSHQNFRVKIYSLGFTPKIDFIANLLYYIRETLWKNWRSALEKPEPPVLRLVVWLGDSKANLLDFPAAVSAAREEDDNERRN